MSVYIQEHIKPQNIVEMVRLGSNDFSRLLPQNLRLKPLLQEDFLSYERCLITGEVLAQNAKNDTKNRSFNSKIGVAENR